MLDCDAVVFVRNALSVLDLHASIGKPRSIRRVVQGGQHYYVPPGQYPRKAHKTGRIILLTKLGQCVRFRHAIDAFL